MSDEGKRSFTVDNSDTNVTGGRYLASSPLAAARKAARQLFKDTRKKTIRFGMRETSQGSEKKVFFYVANKVALDEPKVIVRGDREIKIKTEYKVAACKINA